MNQQGPSAEVELKKGQLITITTESVYKEKSTEQNLWIDYKNLSDVLNVGNRIFIDDGLISLVVTHVGKLPYSYYSLSYF